MIMLSREKCHSLLKLLNDNSFLRTVISLYAVLSVITTFLLYAQPLNEEFLMKVRQIYQKITTSLNSVPKECKLVRPRKIYRTGSF